MKTDELINGELISLIENLYQLQKEVNGFLYSPQMNYFKDYRQDLVDLSNDLGHGLTFVGDMVGLYATLKVEEGLEG